MTKDESISMLSPMDQLAAAIAVKAYGECLITQSLERICYLPGHEMTEDERSEIKDVIAFLETRARINSAGKHGVCMEDAKRWISNSINTAQ